MSAPRPIVIAGPTASGKTGAAVALARRFVGELVGADSVQVYRGFDIGSAKPTADELSGISHHLLDVIDPDEDIDAQRYACRASSVMSRPSRSATPIICRYRGVAAYRMGSCRTCGDGMS